MMPKRFRTTLTCSLANMFPSIDLIIKSVRSIGTIVILELKQTSDENEDKVLTARGAVEQIIRKKYADPYIKRNDIKAVISYGICFCKKECAVAGKKLK